MAVWRHKVIPRCPNCWRAVGPAVHKGCKAVADDNDADLYIDIATGRVRCARCGEEKEITGWLHHCTRCTAVYEGGEIWQGMAAEMGTMDEPGWLKVAGMRQGTMEIAFLGWSSCLACRKRWNADIGWLRTGARAGGLCACCHDAALARFTSLRSIMDRKKACSFCGARRNWGRKVVATGRAAICERCSDIIWQQRQAA